MSSDLEKPEIQNPSVLQPVAPAIETYLHSLASSSNHPVLKAMEERAKEHHFPIVERLVGMFLETMAKSISAKRVFEFGSGYGYSAYWFARAVGEQGRVICSDASSDNRHDAELYLQQAQLWSRIDFQVGYAQQVFAATSGVYDICYNDVDKGDYPEIWQLARERIRPGGLYIADNVLWHGRVAVNNPVDIVPGWTEAIKKHNQMIFDDSNFDAFVNPVRDGVIVARKKD